MPTEKDRDDVAGYVVIAVQFDASYTGVFRIAWEGFENPSYYEMYQETHSTAFPEPGPLLFLGSKRTNGEWSPEAWVKIPETSYLFATWSYLTVEEIEEQEQAARKMAADLSNRDGARAWHQEREGEWGHTE